MDREKSFVYFYSYPDGSKTHEKFKISILELNRKPKYLDRSKIPIYNALDDCVNGTLMLSKNEVDDVMPYPFQRQASDVSYLIRRYCPTLDMLPSLTHKFLYHRQNMLADYQI